ncbi:MAG: cytochrome c peroxidase [Chitinophagales bacterium]|nr:c-type cytochrome [Chitinophagales bacterium]MDW8273618.1 cytochrome c peroxidase [Chitinophagales bacterium]
MNKKKLFFSKKLVLAGIWFLAVSLFFYSCKPDKTAEPDPYPNDPDSLYVGTPYILPRPSPPSLYRRFPDSTFTVEGVLLGRMLFWDPILSADSSISCASCHQPRFAFADSGKQFSSNLSGQTKRNTSSIQNVIWMKRIFWDGRKNNLEDATEDALIDEQHFVADVAIKRIEKRPEYLPLFKKAFGRPGTITKEKIFRAIAMFMRTVISVNSKFDKSRRGQYLLTPEEQRGLEIFSTEKGDCFHCHTDGPYLTFTNNGFENNALDSAVTHSDFKDIGLGKTTGQLNDYGKFKVPTLRNLSYTPPYMHDGRFRTLEEVIDFYSDSLKFSPTISPLMKKINDGGLRLTPQEKKDLIAFLKTLDDPEFVNDTAYSNPFKK